MLTLDLYIQFHGHTDGTKACMHIHKFEKKKEKKKEEFSVVMRCKWIFNLKYKANGSVEQD